MSLLSDRERERLFDELARHAAAGRIDLADLEHRVEVVSRAQTREQAAEAFGELPMSAPPSGPRPRSDTARPGWGRGHAEAQVPQPDWRPTPERFRDPRSGRIMRVWVDGGGARHYVAES